MDLILKHFGHYYTIPKNHVNIEVGESIFVSLFRLFLGEDIDKLIDLKDCIAFNDIDRRDYDLSYKGESIGVVEKKYINGRVEYKFIATDHYIKQIEA